MSLRSPVRTARSTNRWLSSWVRKWNALGQTDIHRSAARAKLSLEGFEDRITPSHFRFSTIAAETTTGNTVMFHIEQSWRWSGTNLQVGQTTSPATLSYGDDLSDNISLTVTSVDTVEDYYVGSATLTHTYSSAYTGQNVVAFMASGNRISTLQNNRDGGFRTETGFKVGDPNDAPLSSLLPVTQVADGGIRTFQIPAIDPNNPNEVLSYRLATPTEMGDGLATQPPGFTVSPTGLVTWDLRDNVLTTSPGHLWSSQVMISDSSGARTAVDFILKVVTSTNVPPVFDTIPTQTMSIPPGGTLTFDVQASDPDSASPVTVTTSNAPSGLTLTPIAATGTNPSATARRVSWTPNPAQAGGTYVITFVATDANGATTQTAVTISPLANQLPTADAGGPYVVGEGGSITLTGVGADSDGSVADYEWDLDYDGTTFGVDSTGQSTTFSAATLDGPLTRTVAFRVRDNLGGTQLDTATVTVENVNPTATLGADFSVLEGQSVTISGTYTDPGVADTHDIHWHVSFNNQVIIHDHGAVLTFTPTAAGTYLINYEVADDDGGEGTDQLTLTVVAIAHEVENPSFELTPDLTGWTPAPGNGSITVVRSGGASHGSAFAVLQSPDQTLPTAGGTTQQVRLSSSRFSAAAGDTIAVDWQAIKTRDVANVLIDLVDYNYPNGRAVSRLQLSNLATSIGWQTAYFTVPAGGGGNNFRLNLEFNSTDANADGKAGADLYLDNVRYVPANVAPLITAVTAPTVVEGSSVTTTVTANDPDATFGGLTYEFDFDNNGSYEVTGAANAAQYVFAAAGTYTIGVRVTDIRGGQDTDTVQVVVAPTPHAIANPSFELTPNLTGWIPYPGPTGLIGVVRTGGASHGSAFGFLRVPITSLSTAGGVTPIVRLDSTRFAAAAGDTIAIDWMAVKTGDSVHLQLSLVDFNLSTNGTSVARYETTAAANSSGWQTAYLTVPAASNNFKLVLNVDSVDANGDKSAGADLYVDNVRYVPANMVPTITAAVQTGGATAGGAPATVTVTATDPDNTFGGLKYDYDFDNDGVYEKTGLGNSAGYTFPAAGVYTVRVRATDARGGSATRTVDVTVVGPPVAVNDSYTTLQGLPTASNLNVTANDTGIGPFKTYVHSLPANYAEFTLNENGTFRFVPIPTFTGTTTFQYRLAANDFLYNVATVTITVTPEPTADGLTLVGNVLVVNATTGYDYLKIDSAGKGVSIYSNLTDWQTESFPTARTVKINLLDGDDNIEVAAGVLVPMVVIGGTGSDYLKLGGGDNIVYGDNPDGSGGGHDNITTGDGNDRIYAGGGHNYVHAGNGKNTVTAGDGNDTIIAGVGNDTINAGHGNNYVHAGDGKNTIIAGSGNDNLNGGSGNDEFYAGDGDNSIHTGNGTNKVWTGSGNDYIGGGSEADEVYAGAGNDSVQVWGGDDIVWGGAGNDYLEGGEGHDILLGEDGDDNLQGGRHNDLLVGGAGSDLVAGGDQNDILVGWAVTADADKMRKLLTEWSFNGVDIRPKLGAGLNDGARDQLLGGGGYDWYFLEAIDISDYNAATKRKN